MKTKYIPLSEQMDFRSYRLSLLLAREMTKALDRFDLTQEKWQILAALWETDSSVSQTRLAELTCKDKPSVSRLVASLIKSDWIVRVDDQKDARAYKLRPSAKADAKKQEIVEAIDLQFAPHHRELGEPARSELRSLLGRYISILDKAQE